MALKERLADAPVIGVALRVQERYKRDAGDQFAGAIGFFGFLSLIPLIVLAASIVGFVLADASAARIAEVAAAVEDAVPGLSAALGGEDGEGVATTIEAIIRNRGGAGLVGLVTLLLAGLRVTAAAQAVTQTIFRVDLLATSGLRKRVNQLMALSALGLLALAGVAATSVVGVLTTADLFGIMAVLGPLLGIVASFVLDVAFFLAAYRLFATRRGPATRDLVPGALLAATGWTALKSFGATYVSRQVASSSELYGALGGVVALLLLLYLAGRLYVYGAELSAVLHPPAGDATSDGSAGPDDDPPSDAGDQDAEDEGAEGEDGGDEAPPPAPRIAPRPDEPAGTISPGTRDRLAAIGDGRASSDPRAAIGFALGVGAVAAMVAAMRPWDTSED